MDFQDAITSPDELRELFGAPMPVSINKARSGLDRHCRAFIERSPFLVIASADADGRFDISPKGDAPGFVRVLDDQTIAIPDRPGNRRFDTFFNILANPRAAVLFLTPGKPETLRVNGRARIVRDAALLESMEARGKRPALALVLDVEETFFHCSKCMIRSNLWAPAAWPSLEGAPSLAQALVEHAAPTMAVSEMEAMIAESIRDRLY